MSAKTKNIPDFLDRVAYNRKDGIILAFDESEALIEFDDKTQEWVKFERIRLVRRAKEWAYLLDGTPIPSVKGLIE